MSCIVTNGTIKWFDVIVRTAVRQPIIWSVLNTIPTSSAVSRKAVESNVPSLSTYLPPGKDISPVCDFRFELRFVKNTYGLSL